MATSLEEMFEKSDTKSKPNLLWCKSIVNITTSNVRTLNTINQLTKLTVYAAEPRIDIICEQERRYEHSSIAN